MWNCSELCSAKLMFLFKQISLFTKKKEKKRNGNTGIFVVKVKTHNERLKVKLFLCTT
jgi:hypothetical protein